MSREFLRQQLLPTPEATLLLSAARPLGLPGEVVSSYDWSGG